MERDAMKTMWPAAYPRCDGTYLWRGCVQRDLVTVAECVHNHRSQYAARDCAEKIMKRFILTKQNGAHLIETVKHATPNENCKTPIKQPTRQFDSQLRPRNGVATSLRQIKLPFGLLK